MAGGERSGVRGGTTVIPSGRHSTANMKGVVLLCLLAVAAAVPVADENGATVSEKEYPAAVRKALDKALEERPKKARQLFHEDLPSRKGRKLRRRLKKARTEGEEKDIDAVGEKKQEDSKGRADLGQGEGWRPMDRAVTKRQLAQGRSLSDPETDSAEASDDLSGETEDSASEDNQLEDREAENSYLSPLYAAAPGGLAGGYGGYGGYGGQGYGPYIYILPIVLPPAGRHPGPGPAARHVVTETGHESHHYSHGGYGGHGQYQPVYAGSHGVPPIYIPKGYGVHGAHHGGHGKHGGHTTVHHEDKTIIRDIDPPIFKA